MVISGDGKLAVSEEAACENVGQLRLLSNNSASVNCPASVSRGGVGPGRRIGGSRESLKGDIGCPALGKELAGLGHLRVQCSSLERPSQLSSVAPLPSCVYTTDRRSLLQCRPPHTCACSLCLLEMGTQQRLTHFRASGPFLEALRCIIPNESCTVIVGPKQRKKKKVAESCLTLCDPTDCKPTGLPHPWTFPGKSTGVGCHFLLQGIFPTQGSNRGLPHCRQTL